MFSKSKNKKSKKAKFSNFKKMNKQIIFQLFENTSKYRQPNKESLNELRNCYEMVSREYISAADFKKELMNLGYKFNKNDEVKLRMRKEIRAKYFF